MLSLVNKREVFRVRDFLISCAIGISALSRELWVSWSLHDTRRQSFKLYIPGFLSSRHLWTLNSILWWEERTVIPTVLSSETQKGRKTTPVTTPPEWRLCLDLTHSVIKTSQYRLNTFKWENKDSVFLKLFSNKILSNFFYYLLTNLSSVFDWCMQAFPCTGEIKDTQQSRQVPRIQTHSHWYKLSCN